jgi:uncharacterized protein YsxB (DUF464 family)
MTRVTAARSGEVFRLKAEGHAAYNPGSDVVCAGISALTQSLLSWCRNRADVEVLSFRANPGDFFLEAEGGAAEAPFEAAILGLQGIAESYPDHVSVCAQNFF